MARRPIHPDVLDEICVRPVSATGFDARDRAIAFRRGGGESVATLAQEYGVSERKVAQIYCNQAREARRRIAVRQIDALLDKIP